MGSCVNSLLPSCDNWSSGVPKLFVCRTVCTRLHDCEMCTSYSSYKLDDSYTRITTTCGWCASLQKCFPRINDDEDRDLCPETLLNDTCADENIPNGVYALRSYDGKSIPSEVLLIEDKLSIEISRPSRFQARGFLHWSVIKPETFAFNFYRFNGNVKFWLRDCSANMTIDGKDSNTDVVTLNDRKSTCTRSYGINQTTICELEIRFKYFGADTTGLFSFKKIADRKKLKMRLEPFRSGNKCASHVDCLSCAVDWSCAWCSLSHLCNNRMEMKFQPNSCSSQQEQDISVITNPTSCVVCNDSLTCRTCNSQQLCRWDQETNKCRTIDVGEKSMEETDGCPVVCEEHYTCSTCLHPTTCYWCGESETCHHKSSQQHLSCYQPLLSRHDCVSCDTKKSCYHCLENQRCGWCGSDVNPYQGYCSSVTDVRAEDCHLKSSQIHHNIYCPLMNECTWISESGETVHGCDVNADCTDMLWFNQCRCKRGYVGDGNTCQRTCYNDCGNGHCSGSPLFQCICNLGWTSTDLQSSQRCTVDCNCNLHSTCTEGVGICDLCMDNTRGRSCERCMRGYHRSVGNLKSSSCVSCDCNGHHSSGSSDVCDENTGECDCDQFTQGFNCQRCRDGYYGVSRNGGRCRLSCSDRLSLNETRGDFGVHNSSQYEFCYVIISSQQSSDVIRLNISRIYNIDCETTRLYVYNGMRNSSRLSVTFCDGLPDDGASVVSHTGQMLIMFESSAANSGFDAEYEILKVDDYNQPKYPSPSLFGNSLVYFNDSLLSFGGFSYEFSQKAIFRYRFEADTWSPVYSSPVGEEHPGARFLHASLVMGSDMYIYGGLTSDDYRVFADNRMWWRSLTDDDGTKHWERDDQTTTPGIPPQLARPSLVAMGSNKLLLLGGIRPVVTFNKQIWQFNIRTKRWRNMTGITLPIQQGIISLSAVYDEQQNSLFVFANVVAGNQSDSIFIACNLTSKSWTSLQRHLPAIINQPATRVSFSLGGGLLLFDGATSWLFLTSHLHWIDVSSITDGHLSHHNTDHASWYVHGNVSTDIKLFVYGGLLRGNISNHLQIVKMNVSCLAVTSSQECEVEMRQICQLKTCSSNTQVCKSKSSSTPSDDNLCKKFSFSKSFQSECLRFRTCYECSANDACGWCEDSCDGSRGKCVTKGTCRGSLRPRLSYGRIRTCKQQIPYHQKCGGDAEECGGGLLSGNCAYYRRCDECLRNNCSWVVLVDRCVSRAIERVVCVNSNCGRILHRNTGACRSNKCEGRRSCFTCLQAPGCVWGMAADGCSLSKLPLKQYWNDDDDVNPHWKFMVCPIEDECGTGTHDCDRHEKCVDLPKGYECVCKDGYKPRPIPPLKCLPHCDQPCVSGTCVEPNICGCNLGFYGERCEKKCNCNGMSNCTDPVRCVKCVFNTFGRQCQYCKKGYVGDPTAVRLEDGASKVCNTCREVCNGRSDLCRGVNHRSNISEVTCDDCTGNSEGRLCEKCKDGFFELNGNCSRCLCHNLNGDRNVCDKETGTKCQCSEHAVSSKPECNQQSTTFVQCWKFQCDKCEAGYMGRPHTRSSPCYKWQPVNKQLCFDASDPTYCYDQTTKSLNQNRYQLQAGRSIRFAVKPRPLSKAKYRIHIKVLMGEVDVFVVVDQLTFFRITVDNSTGDEHVVGETDPIVTDRKNKKNKFTLKKFTARAQPNLNYHVTMGKHDAVQVESVSDRLIITRQGDHRDELIYVIILAKRTTNTRMKRQISGGGGDIVGASGNFIFRQDEPRLDLFVFFSCFFCSFGVISVFSTLVWKVRLAMSNRRARINQALQMIPLARRPCRLIYVLIDTSITVQTHSSVATTAANKTISSVTSSTVVTSTGCMASTSSSSSSSPHPSATHHRSILHKQDRSHVTSYPSRTIPLPHNTADHAIVVQNTDGSLRLTPEERDSSPCSSSSSSSWTQSSPVVAVRTPKSEMKSVRFAPSPDCLKRRHSSVPRIKASKQPLIMQPIYRNRSLSVVTYLAVMPGERATPIFISALASTDDTSAVFDDDELNEVDMKKHHRATIFSHFTSS